MEEPSELADLIQIKPSQLEMHEKVEKPTVLQPQLPKVPRASQKQLTEHKK